MSIIQVKVFKIAEQDNFENGCGFEGSKSTDFGMIVKEEFSDMRKALEFCKSFDEANSVIIFDGRLEMQRQENGAANAPTKEEYELFRTGKIDLWLANYSCYLTKIERTPLGNEELKAAFPELSEA